MDVRAFNLRQVQSFVSHLFLYSLLLDMILMKKKLMKYRCKDNSAVFEWIGRGRRVRCGQSRCSKSIGGCFSKDFEARRVRELSNFSDTHRAMGASNPKTRLNPDSS